MRVAVTGASGFIGSALVNGLAAAGHRVTALVRSGSRRDHVAPFVDRFVEGDHADESCWPALLDGAECVIHNSVERGAWDPGRPDALDFHLRSNLVGSVRLLRASWPRQFIFVSSMAVHRELSPRRTGQLEERNALPGSYYAAYKAAVEAHVQAENADGRATAIIRPCRVYGIDPVLERSRGYDLIQALRRGGATRGPDWGGYIHVEDVAAATVAVVGNTAVSGCAYDLVDCWARDADWAAMAAQVLGIEIEVDLSGPGRPGYAVNGDAARLLGVALDRGHEGIRRHLAELARG